MDGLPAHFYATKPQAADPVTRSDRAEAFFAADHRIGAGHNRLTQVSDPLSQQFRGGLDRKVKTRRALAERLEAVMTIEGRGRLILGVNDHRQDRRFGA